MPKGKPGRKRKYDPEVFKKLRAKGLTYQQIMIKTGASLTLIQYYLNPKIKKLMDDYAKKRAKDVKVKAQVQESRRVRYAEDEEYRKKRQESAREYATKKYQEVKTKRETQLITRAKKRKLPVYLKEEVGEKGGK